jgi:hypothetical protein
VTNGKGDQEIGAAGNLPAPVGNLPTGTAEILCPGSWASFLRNAAAVPSGWQPDGTGWQPVLPGSDYSDTF